MRKKQCLKLERLRVALTNAKTELRNADSEVADLVCAGFITSHLNCAIELIDDVLTGNYQLEQDI
jgi:hypothetical protein